MALTQKRIQHFYLRTGFGETPAMIATRSLWPQQKMIDRLFNDSKNPEPITILPNPTKNNNEIVSFRTLKMVLKSRKKTKEVSLGWTKQMANSNAQLREKMTLFWHNHFATKLPFAYLMQEQNNTIRMHALGSFRELLNAIATDPAMIMFLSNQQNRKRKPNENFAREVMELFTLGEGNYTETDIKEAARAFTGWQVNRLGEFEVNQKHHDNSSKKIFGKTGNFGGKDVIDMLLSNKQTAAYISRKLYRFLVNHKENEIFIHKMADIFYNSDYNIEKLLRFVFNSSEFMKGEHVGTRIASPVELIVRYLRVFKLKFKKDRIILQGQRTLGQIPLFPPTVAGWSEQREWIDSSSLLYRMRLPFVVFGDSEISGKTKNELNLTEGTTSNRNPKEKWMQAESDWTDVTSACQNHEVESILSWVLSSFIQTPISSIDKAELLRFADSRSPETSIKSLTMHVMALPEFQLI